MLPAEHHTVARIDVACLKVLLRRPNRMLIVPLPEITGVISKRKPCALSAVLTTLICAGCLLGVTTAGAEIEIDSFVLFEPLQNAFKLLLADGAGVIEPRWCAAVRKQLLRKFFSVNPVELCSKIACHFVPDLDKLRLDLHLLRQIIGLSELIGEQTARRPRKYLRT